MKFMNIKNDDPQKEIVEQILNELLSCSDAKYITEIFVKDGSLHQGYFGNWVAFMVELDPKFANESLYNTIDDLDETLENNATTFVISVEPDAIDRSHGTVLYQKED